MQTVTTIPTSPVAQEVGAAGQVVIRRQVKACSMRAATLPDRH